MHLLLSSLARRGGIELSEAQFSQLESYLALLLEANARMNLTRITDPEAARLLHLGDALTLLPLIPREARSLADVGSGGGVPGIVLAIVRPDLKISLIESTNKKADFLSATAAQLQLPLVRVVPLRAEQVAVGPMAASFDVVIARALGPMERIAPWTLPLARVGGVVLAMKGPKAADELTAAHGIIRHLGGQKAQIIPAELPGQSHVIVSIRKTRPTPAPKRRRW